MRNKQYQALLERRAELALELEGLEVPEAHQQLRYRLTGEWMARDDRRVEIMAEPGRQAWSPRDGTGFAGPYGFDANYPGPEAEEKPRDLDQPAPKLRLIPPPLF